MAATQYGHFLGLVVILSVINGVFMSICKDSECNFELKIRWSQTMATKPSQDRQYFKVGLFGKDLKVISYPTGYVSETSLMMGAEVDSDHVITGDGHVRNVITINGQFPGPALQVTEGAMVS